MSTRSRLLLLVLLPSVVACRGAMDPDSPRGVLAQVFDAYAQADARKLYRLVSPETKRLVAKAFQDIGRLDAGLREHLPIGVREEALETSAVESLGKAVDELDLFARLVQLDRIHVDSGVESGMKVVDASISGDQAVLTTAAGQKFELVKTPDGWRTRHLEPLLAAKLKVLEANLAKLDSYVSAVAARDEEVQRLLGGGGGDDPGAATSKAVKPKPRKRKKRRHKRARRRRRHERRG